jgi:hypothetical protein
MRQGVGRIRSTGIARTTWSEDAHARAVLALAQSVVDAPDAGFRAATSALFARALPATRELQALRARSAALLACDAAVRAGGGGEIARTYDELALGLQEELEEAAMTATWP